MLKWYCRTYNQDFLPKDKRLDYIQVPVLWLMLVCLTVVICIETIRMWAWCAVDGGLFVV